MKRLILLFISIIIISVSLSGQEKTLRNFPMQISFVYPLGTHGVRSANFNYNFSINLLTGSVGSITGCEVGGLLNMNKSFVEGFQAAGLLNITNGHVKGMQAAGIGNISNSMQGFQTAAVYNIVNADIKGLQSSGIFNISVGMKGYQTAGIMNIAQNAKGLQTAGILNLSESEEGVQAAGIVNINKEDMRGVQVAGIINQSKRVNGLQLALINITDTIEKGIAFGLIQAVKKGFHDEIEVSIADYMNIGFSYKAGIKSFYNIYSVGYNYLKDNLIVTGLGFGHLMEVNKNLSFRPEIIYYAYMPDDFKNIRYTNANHLKLGMVFKFDKKLALAVVPSIYVAIKDRKDREYGYEISPVKPAWWHNGNNSRVEMGIGLSVGLSIF